jgi:hypothetical protein
VANNNEKNCGQQELVMPSHMWRISFHLLVLFTGVRLFSWVLFVFRNGVRAAAGDASS